MTLNNTPPQFPAGAYEAPGLYDEPTRHQLIGSIAAAPRQVRAAVAGLADQQLDTKYRNWTIRQIVHHLADSHMNCFIRFKWALTEDSPLIKAYDEGLWSEVADATESPIECSLTILEGLHARWVQMLERLSSEQMEMSFFHPEQMKEISLAEALPSYVWHTDHHVAQIRWLRQRQGW